MKLSLNSLLTAGTIVCLGSAAIAAENTTNMHNVAPPNVEELVHENNGYNGATTEEPALGFDAVVQLSNVAHVFAMNEAEVLARHHAAEPANLFAVIQGTDVFAKTAEEAVAGKNAQHTINHQPAADSGGMNVVDNNTNGYETWKWKNGHVVERHAHSNTHIADNGSITKNADPATTTYTAADAADNGYRVYSISDPTAGALHVIAPDSSYTAGADVDYRTDHYNDPVSDAMTVAYRADGDAMAAPNDATMWRFSNSLSGAPATVVTMDTGPTFATLAVGAANTDTVGAAAFNIS